MNRLTSELGGWLASRVLRCPEKRTMYRDLLRGMPLGIVWREVAARRAFDRRSACCTPSGRVGFEVSNCCNLRCTHCPQPSLMSRTKGLMEFALYEMVVEANNHIRKVNLWGWGEPLLHPQLPEFIRFAHRRKIRTAITTNATLLTPEKSIEILDAGINQVMFSLDNVGTDYEKIRGGDWDTVANNVRRFIDLTAKGGREVLVSANVVHSPSNPVDRSAIIASLAKLGVPRVDITSCSMFHSNVGRRTARAGNGTASSLCW